MNIDSFLKFFVPKDHSFFPLFEADAHNLIKATELLKELVSTTDIAEHERLYKEIRDDVDGSLFTPFIRGDGQADPAYQIEFSCEVAF